MTERELPYLVLNRWGGEFSEYDRYLGLPWERIAYLSTSDAVPALGGQQACHVSMLPTLDYRTVLPVAERIAARTGGFAGVVAISEYDVVTGALLRERFRTSGYPPKLVLRFKDKVLMKAAVSAAGRPVPRYLALRRDLASPDILAHLRLPIILKPRRGAASTGVIRVDDSVELASALATVVLDEYECEEFVAGEIIHVDGIRRDGGFHFVSVSAYVNTCLDFALGRPLGSVLLDDTPRRTAMVEFAESCLDALGLADGPFHLELIDASERGPVFLEVGLRPGGGEVTYIHKDLFGVDLVGEAVRATAGRPVLTPAGEFTPVAAGGFVMIPEPGPFPSRVVERSSLIGSIPGLYAEFLPDIGEVFDGHGGYEHVGGRFHLRGDNEAQVRAAMNEIIDRYRVVAEPTAPAVGVPA